MQEKLARAISYRILPSQSDPTLENYALNRYQAEALTAYQQGAHVLIDGTAASGKTQLLLAVLNAYQQNRNCSPTGSKLEEQLICLAPNRERADWLNTAPAVIKNRYGRIWRTPVAAALNLAQNYAQARSCPYPVPYLLTGAQEENRIRKLLEAENFSCLPQVLQESADFVQEIRNLFARCLQWGIDPQLLDYYGHKYGQEQWVEAARLFSRYQFTYQEDSLDQAAAQERACELIEQGWENDPEVTQSLPVPELVLVDDLQDLTAITARMLRAWASRGAQIVACSNAEVAVEGYRGGEVTNLDFLCRELAAPRKENQPENNALRTVYHRRWENSYRAALLLHESPKKLGNLQVGAVKAEQIGDLASQVAAVFRQAHVERSISWADMAVICRNQDAVEAIARALSQTDIPLSSPPRPSIFRKLPGCKGLIQAIGIALYQEEYMRAGGDIAELLQVGQRELLSLSSEELAAYEKYRELLKNFLNTPLIGISSFDLSRLKRVDQAERFLSVGTGDYLGYLEPALIELAPKLDRAHRVITAARKALRRSPIQGLGELWEASEQAENWQQLALQGQKAGDDYLDALLSLFAHCHTYTQQHPQQQLSDYYQLLLEQNQPEDHLAKLGQRPPGVQILTTARAAGRNWAVVVVASLENGVWPNTAIRDTTLGGRILTEVHRGKVAADPGATLTYDYLTAYRENLADEARLFHAATSRARETLILGALDDGEQVPSGFFNRASEILKTHPNQVDLSLKRHGSMRELIAHMRQVMLKEPADSPDYARAKKILLMLSSQGVSDANPKNWRQCADLAVRLGTEKETRTADAPQLNSGLGEENYAEPARSGGKEDWYTTRENLQEDSALKYVSPSALGIIADCPLRWFWNRHLGFDPQAKAARLGTIVHALAESGAITDLEQTLAQVCQEIGINPQQANLEQSREVEKIEKILYWLKRHLEETPEGISEISVQAEPETTTRITAQIDRLENFEDKLRILDFKTGKKPDSEQGLAGKYQLLAYQIVLEEALEKYRAAQAQGKTLPASQVAGQLQELFAQAQAYVAEHAEANLEVSAALLYLNKDLPASSRAKGGYVLQSPLSPEQKATVKAFIARTGKVTAKGTLCAVVSGKTCEKCAFAGVCPRGNSPHLVQ